MSEIPDSVISGELRSRLRELDPGDGSDSSCVITFDAAFRGFEGHFEGNPIVPGVCLIELARVHAEELLKRAFTVTEIHQSRFRRPIFAGESARCTLKVQIPDDDPKHPRIRAEVRCGDAVACQLRLTLEDL